MSVFVTTNNPVAGSTGSPVFGRLGCGLGLLFGGGGAMGPCQSKCTRPKRWPGCAGSKSGIICVALLDTVPVPYFTITPRVGLSVSSSICTPGGVLRVFGNVTATGWLAVELAG